MMPTDDRGVHTHDFRLTGRCVCGQSEVVAPRPLPPLPGGRQEPCIGCTYGDGPLEDCPVHGRPYGYWVALARQAENKILEDSLNLQGTTTLHIEGGYPADGKGRHRA